MHSDLQVQVLVHFTAEPLLQNTYCRTVTAVELLQLKLLQNSPAAHLQLPELRLLTQRYGPQIAMLCCLW